MIMGFKCPICGQEHHLYINNKLLRGDVVDTICPVMHEAFKLKLVIKFSVPVSFEKSDIEVAEEEARLSDHTWRTEEGVLFDTKDSN